MSSSPPRRLWSGASVRAVFVVCCSITEYQQILCTFCAPPRWRLSYHLYYYFEMAVRQKRSISLPPELAEAIDHAAAQEGTTVSAWLADTAAHRLRLDAGRRGIAEWERTNGPLTADELADGLARARAVLRGTASSRKRA